MEISLIFFFIVSFMSIILAWGLWKYAFTANSPKVRTLCGLLAKGFFVAFFITLVHDITFKTDLPVILSNITSIGALIYFYFYYYRKNSP